MLNVSSSKPLKEATRTKGGSGDAGTPTVWGPVAAFIIVILTYVSQFLAPLIGMVYISIIGKEHAFSTISSEKLTPETWFVLVLAIEVLALSVLYAFLRARRITFWQGVGLRFREFRLSYLAYAALGFLCYLALTFGALLIIQHLPFLDTTQAQAIGFETSDISSTGLFFAFASLVILPPLAEEMIFRGFLFGSLRRTARFIWASILTSLFFGALHLMTGESGLLWIAAIDTFLLSLVLCYAREVTGNIWTSIFIHALKNSMAFLLLFKLSLF